MKYEPTFVRTIKHDCLTDLVRSFVPKSKECFISFAIYKSAGTDELGEFNVIIPDIQSDKPVFNGTYNFLIDNWKSRSVAKMSKPYQNPTWEDIIIACNELLEEGDRCGVFLEGLEEKEQGIIEFKLANK